MFNLFLQTGKLPIQVQQVQNQPDEYDRNHGYYHEDFSVGTHGIGHFNILLSKKVARQEA